MQKIWKRAMPLVVAAALIGGRSLFVPAADAPKKDKGQDKPAPTAADLIKDVKVPAGFNVGIFALPPDIRYPTCLAATPTGELFVGCDENGSLDAKPDRGRVIKCVDTKGTGKADKFTEFAKMDSPRGLVWSGDTLYVLHPPFITAYHDPGNTGVATKQEDIVKGIGFDLKFRGADHTTNGLRMGIDGWLYIASGDYGAIKAVGTDGKELQYHGGGILRVRPDGSELEMFGRHTRNVYDVAIDPLMNIFARDNTNDGDGWDSRLAHIHDYAEYGYPSLYMKFKDEIVAPLADYGGGSATGSLFMSEPGWPVEYGNALYTCDWGRSEVYRHPLAPNGSTFTHQAGEFPAHRSPHWHHRGWPVQPLRGELAWGGVQLFRAERWLCREGNPAGGEGSCVSGFEGRQ